MRRLVLLLVTAGSLAMAACASGPAGPTPPSPPASPSPSPSPTPSPSPSPSPPLAAASLPPIEITRTGGFIGVHQSLQISTDGRWVYAGAMPATSGTLAASARTRLREIVLDPRLPAQVVAAPPGRCCDMFQYELRVDGRTYEFGEPDLGPLLTELLELLHEQTNF